MRGLDIRVKLAIARIQAIHDGKTSKEISDYSFDVYLEAEALGYHDASTGQLVPPVMFNGEPDLLFWWKNGNEFYLSRDCPWCNDDITSSCPEHG